MSACVVCLGHVTEVVVVLCIGQCGNKECPFLHVDPETKRRDCPWYDRGFCRHGMSGVYKSACQVTVIVLYDGTD